MTNDEGSERPRKIVHVDMDAFHASVEQRDNPDLRGLPVAVGYPAARGVVAAASYEAKVRRSFGDGFGHREAQCPNLIFVKPRFEVYKAISLQLRAIFAEYTPMIEPLSLDEALSRCFRKPEGHGDSHRHRPGDPGKDQSDDRAQRLRRHLLQQVPGEDGFRSEQAGRQFVITPKNGPAFVEQLPIKKFHGFGPATAEKMHRLGIETRADLKEQTLEFLVEHFGKSGPYFYGIARGIDNRQVKADRVRKSVAAEDTSSEDIHSFEAAREGLQPLIEKVWSYCEANEISAKTVTLKVKYADFPDHPEQDGCGTFANDR